MPTVPAVNGSAMEAYGLALEHAPLGATIVMQCWLLLDGVPVEAEDMPTATCSVTGGTAIDEDPAVVSDGNQYRATLDLSNIETGGAPAELGDLTVTWTFDGPAGDFTQILRVVGRRVASLGDLNASLDRNGENTTWSEGEKRIALQLAIDAFEQEVDIAFSRRRITEKVTTRGSTDGLILANSDVHELHTVTSVGDWTGDVADLELDEDEVLGSFGADTYTLTYTYGRERPPADIPRVIALIASGILASGPFDDRGYSVSDDAGIVRLLTAGVSGASFSIPEVQAALVRYRVPWVGSA